VYLNILDKVANNDILMLLILILLVLTQVLKRFPIFTPTFISIKALGKILPRIVKKLINKKK